MKVFMIFIALLIINTSFMIYHGDLNNYVKLQTYLKALAEEAAAGAALYYDEEAYGNGLMVVNESEGEKYINDLIKQAGISLKLKEDESLSFEFEAVDDGRDGSSALPPSVTVTINLTGREMFRLPFISRDRIVRSAKYELAGF